METYDDPSGGMIAAFFAMIMIPAIIISVITIIGMWKMFGKAGKPGWAAIIPIYNTIVMLEIVGKPIWWIVLFLIPCANIVVAIWVQNLISKSFGKSEGFTVGLILLPWIFYPILGFGSATYLGPSASEATRFNSPNDPFNTPPQV